MLGVLLYETLDLGYNVIRLLYNVSTGTYKWYYNIDSKNYDEKKLEELIIKEKEDNKEILNLNERIKKLENYINVEFKKK
tara:strand:- start:1273 stop:1512 length:240 start_codon:yes stop_codon:yes gene_type:complete